MTLRYLHPDEHTFPVHKIQEGPFNGYITNLLSQRGFHFEHIAHEEAMVKPRCIMILRFKNVFLLSGVPLASGFHATGSKMTGYYSENPDEIHNIIFFVSVPAGFSL